MALVTSLSSVLSWTSLTTSMIIKCRSETYAFRNIFYVDTQICCCFAEVEMSFWSENYSFIKEVYDTRVNKMVEWMDQVEIAITKVMATKVYTSAEFKRERDNFLSLIKNLEKSETKKWLDEVKETLFKDRAGDERKEEHQRLEAVIERHQTLIPRVHETQVKSEVGNNLNFT